jgi:nicotinate-nucleotide adenylyltransferase
VKLAVLGGSFNPVHLGHLHLAESVLAAFRYDRLLLVPANISPFKVPGVPDDTQKSSRETHSRFSHADVKEYIKGSSAPLREKYPDIKITRMAEGADRLDMILASITGDSRIAVDDLELRRGGVSYTVDTLKEIIARYRPEGKPALVLGDDLAADFSKWKDAEEVARIADIIIARRMVQGVGAETAGAETASAGEAGAGEAWPFPHTMLNNEVIDISSEMIRERIAAGKAWRYLVPRGARHIIEERGLYGVSKPERNDYARIIARVEDAARECLSSKRFIHSRNTALLARDIAFRYGLDGNAAYLAGVAHDMAKPREPGLSHGRAAAVLLRERFGIHNKDVLEAVEHHTTGKAGMGSLAKAVFVADKIEYSRGNEQAEFREMALQEDHGLEELFHAVLKDNVLWLQSEGIETAADTLDLLEGDLPERKQASPGEAQI